MGFEGRKALVTGAGSGIGRAVAAALASAGVEVACCARTTTGIEETVESIHSGGGSAWSATADVADSKSVLNLFAQIEERNRGRLDILVTCAAAGPAAGPSESFSDDDWDRVLGVDLSGCFRVNREAGRLMLKGGYGRIVNLASFHVTATYPQRAAYVAAKAGVVGMSQALAVEWGGRGVTVNTVAPGPIKTPRTSWFMSQSPENAQGMISRTPSGRVGELADVVSPILFLCSEEAIHINGQMLTVDGGWTKNAWWGTHPFKG